MILKATTRNKLLIRQKIMNIKDATQSLKNLNSAQKANVIKTCQYPYGVETLHQILL